MSLTHLLFQFNFLSAARFTFIAPVFISHFRSLIMFARENQNFLKNIENLILEAGNPLTDQSGDSVATGPLGR